MQLGVIGLGRMGANMVRRLDEERSHGGSSFNRFARGRRERW